MRVDLWIVGEYSYAFKQMVQSLFRPTDILIPH